MPNWNSLESVAYAYRILSWTGLISGMLVAFFGVVGSFAAVGGYFYGIRKDELSSKKQEEELERIRSVVHNMNAQMSIDFSWPNGKDPLIPVDQGQVQGDEVQLELSDHDQWGPVGYAKLVFRRSALYEIARTSPTSAIFRADLFIRQDSFPIGQQKSELNAMKFLRVLMPIKGYWMNGRDDYQLRISRVQIEIKINGSPQRITLPDMGEVQPSHPYDNVIWGYLIKSAPLPVKVHLGR